MATWTSLHSLVSLVVVVAASGYDVVDPFASVVVITPHCGDSTTDSAWLEVKTDVAISGEVVCESNERIAFRANDTATFYTPLFYDGSTTGRCVFAKKETADVYTIQVDVSRGERGSEIEAPEQKYQVMCVFGSRGPVESSNHWIVEPFVAPTEAQTHEGDQSTSGVAVWLSDVLGGELPSSGVHIGRKVVLQARSNGSGNELGIRPVACELVGMTTGKTYVFLKAGCGDGLVLKKDQGFQTNGLLSVSPPFRMISVSKDVSVKFRCNFTLCPHNCDGDSCRVEQKRSASHDDGLTTTVDSDPVNVILIEDDQGDIVPGIAVDDNDVGEHQSTAKSPSIDLGCIDCKNQISSPPTEPSTENDLRNKYDSLPPADILPNVNTMKAENQRWPQLSFGNYAMTIQSAWPLGLAVLMAIGMFSTLVVATLLVCRHGRAEPQANAFDEYDSLLK